MEEDFNADSLRYSDIDADQLADIVMGYHQHMREQIDSTLLHMKDNLLQVFSDAAGEFAASIDGDRLMRMLSEIELDDE